MAAVTLKTPPFWLSDSQIWFAQVKAQFNTKGIANQKTKFEHIVSSLLLEVAQEVRDHILSPPIDWPYDVLKKQQRLQQLFNAEELGDRKPTQLVRRMQQVLSENASGTDASFLHELFLQ